MNFPDKELTEKQKQRLEEIQEKHGRKRTISEDANSVWGEFPSDVSKDRESESNDTADVRDGRTGTRATRAEDGFNEHDIGTNGNLYGEDGFYDNKSGEVSRSIDQAAYPTRREDDKKSATTAEDNNTIKHDHKLSFEPLPKLSFAQTPIPLTSGGEQGKKRGRPPGSTKKQQIKAPLIVPSQKSLEEEKQELIENLIFYSEQLDIALGAITKGHEVPDIWALSEKEATLLAEVALNKAKNNKYLAIAIKEANQLRRDWTLATIGASRFFGTIEYIFRQGLSLR